MDNLEMEIFKRIATALEAMAATEQKIAQLWERQEVRNIESHKQNAEYFPISVRDAEARIRLHDVLTEKEKAINELWKPKPTEGDQPAV